MNPATVSLGPLALSTPVLLLLAASGLGIALGARLGRRAGQGGVADHAFRVLLAALVVARLAFVWQFRHAYLASPLDIVDIRDGGWEPQAGAIAAWMYVLVLIRRHPPLKRPLLAGTGLASVLWMAGNVGLALGTHDPALLPPMNLPSFEGGNASLAAFQGKPTVVNLWATWCPPCQREMPLLSRAQKAHPELHLVFVNQGQSLQQVREFLSAHGLVLDNVLLDPKGLAGTAFGQRALPTTLFFDAQGRLVDQRIGELNEASLQQRLDALKHPR